MGPGLVRQLTVSIVDVDLAKRSEEATHAHIRKAQSGAQEQEMKKAGARPRPVL